MDSPSRHHVVIIGGGFGGLWTTRSLRKANVRITLVDKRNFHLFQPLLYQVATGGLSPADIASPLRSVLSRQPNVTVRMAEMVGIDSRRQVAILNDGELHYDSLIVATGSENHYYGNDQWRSVAPGLKTVEDALHIRNKVYSTFEAAERESDGDERRRLMTFVLVGGGATGVELAGALAEIARITLRENFRSIDPSAAQIILLEGGSDILPVFDPKLQKAARKSLARLGVEVRTGVYAKHIDESGLIVNEGDREFRIESRTVLWAAGVRPSPLGKMLVSDENQLDKSGRVKVTDNLNLPQHSNIYVIGDLALVTDKHCAQLPGLAPVAMSEGRYVADLIISKLRNETPKSYTYRDKGQLAVIGRAAAVADLGRARFTGYPAWLLWLFVHLMYLVEFENRLLVFIQWAWNYFTRNRGARLITYDRDSPGDQPETAQHSEDEKMPAG